MKRASAIAVLIVTVLSLTKQNLPVAQAQSSDSSIQSPLERQIVAKEREGLDALKIGNLKAFGDLTAEDAIFVDAHGSATKAQVMKNVEGFRLTDYTIDDLSFVSLSAESGLISYKISDQGISHGKEFAAKAFVSSIWVKRGGGWLCLFSQETGVR
jgi:hypothetical protein